MGSRIVTIYLSIAVVIGAIIFVTSYASNVRLPGNNEGFEPIQPTAFSHRLHAGELSIQCLHCHGGAEKSSVAGIPSANVCMNCHRYVTAPILDVRAEEELAAKEGRKPQPVISPELNKLYRAMGLNSAFEPDSATKPKAIEWANVHNVPDYVYFNHRAHVTAGVECRTCHGAVETMERVRQVSDLSMGWCVNCHRDVTAAGVNGKEVHASTDCSTCHY